MANGDKLQRFTQRARRVLALAQEEAERLSHNYIGTEHLLLGIVREENGIAGRVLRELGAKPERVAEMVERMTGAGRRGARRASTRRRRASRSRRWGCRSTPGATGRTPAA